MFISVYFISQQLTWLPTSHTRDLPGGKITTKFFLLHSEYFYYILNISISFQIFLITIQIFLSHSIYLLFHSKYFHYIPYISHYIQNNDENLKIQPVLTEMRLNWATKKQLCACTGLIRNTFRDGGRIVLHAVYIVDTVGMVFNVDTVDVVDTVDIVYTVQTALHCVNSSMYAYTYC